MLKSKNPSNSPESITNSSSPKKSTKETENSKNSSLKLTSGKKINAMEAPKVSKNEIPTNLKPVVPADIIAYGMYHPTMWDPLLSSPEYSETLKDISDRKGYLSHHRVSKDKSLFGNLSLLTFNAYCQENIKSDNDAIVQTVKDMLDHAHPTFLAIQSIRKRPMDEIRSILGTHYRMINTEKWDKDLISSANLYDPIIYDTRLVKAVKAGYLEEKGGNIYGSFLRVVDLRKKGELIYTIVNVDLFSSFKDTVNAQLMNLTSDITGDPETQSHPLFMLGTINVIPELFSTLLANQYENLITKDFRNNDIFKTTVHGNGSNNDDIQRDFIILRDPGKNFMLNYARILSSIYTSAHFPVHAILTFAD